MFKIILAFCLLLAVAKGWEDTTTTTANPLHEFGYESGYNTEFFIDLHKQQNAGVIQDFDTKLKRFKEKLAKNVEEINRNGALAYEVIHQTNQNLNPLEFRSESDKQCVSIYRKSIPSVVETEDKIKKCVDNFKKDVEHSLEPAEKVRHGLENYYFGDLIVKLDDCKKSFNRWKCISDVIDETNRLTIEKQKEFEAKIEAAECIPKVNSKRSVDCAFTVQADTSTDAFKAIHLLSKCIKPEHQCRPCSFRCDKHFELTPADHEGKTIHNPFYHSKYPPECLLATLQEKAIILHH